MNRIHSYQTETAWIVGPGELRFLNDRLTWCRKDHSPMKLDVSTLKRLFCVGDVSFSDKAVQGLLQNDVAVSVLSAHGNRCYGLLTSLRDDSVRIRLGQYAVHASSTHQLAFAKHWVELRIQSMRDAARHYQRHGISAAGSLMSRLDGFAKMIAGAQTGDELRGVEGTSTREWFQMLRLVLKAPWTFEKRVRRPPTDPVNAMLSLSSTWLCQRVTAELKSRGFEISLGTLHGFRHGRPSLACDAMEPLRGLAMERWTISQMNEGRLRMKDFVRMEDGGMRLEQSVFRDTIADWEQHWQTANLQRRLTELVDDYESKVRQLVQVPDGVDDGDF